MDPIATGRRHPRRPRRRAKVVLAIVVVVVLAIVVAIVADPKLTMQVRNDTAAPVELSCENHNVDIAPNATRPVEMSVFDPFPCLVFRVEREAPHFHEHYSACLDPGFMPVSLIVNPRRTLTEAVTHITFDACIARMPR